MATLSTVSSQNCLQLKAVLWTVIEKMQKTLVKRLALRAGDAADAGGKTVNYGDVSAKADLSRVVVCFCVILNYCQSPQLSATFARRHLQT